MTPMSAGKRGGRGAALLLAGLALLHGLLYAWLVPPWQTPDEPAQFLYAAMIAQRGRTPLAGDTDPALERRLVDSLVRERFFEYLTGHPPAGPLETFADAQAQFFMPNQIGTDPPLYFWLAALPIRLLAAQPIEAQLRALRLMGVLITVGAVLCAYAAARELELEPGFALAAGLLVALQPMFSFVGMAAGNDGLANLVGAALAWALLRAARRGLSWRRAALVLALAVVGVLVKRTMLSQALLVGLIGLGWALLRLARAPLGTLARVGLLVALLAATLGARVAMAGDRSPTKAAEWIDMADGASAPRLLAAPGTGRPALAVGREQTIAQVLPDVTAEWAQNQELYVSARVWSGGEQRVRGVLVIDFGWKTIEQPFSVDQRGRVVRMHTLIPLYCPYVYVAVHALSGPLYVDKLSAESARRRGLNLLLNGDLHDASVRAGTPTALLRRFLRLRELGWVWRSGRLLEEPPLGGWLLGRVFFVTFWGQFGWMSLPLVGGAPWEAALYLVCGAGLIGVVAWLLAPGQPAWRRRAVLLMLALVAAGVLLPLLNAYTAPRNQVIQQGRYLFPALAPVALLLALGWRALLPPRMRPAGLVVGLLFALAFAYAALQVIWKVY